MLDFNQRQRLLLALLILNVIATGVHYADNFFAFSNYPAPTWMLPKQVYEAWLALTPFALVGGIFYSKKRFWSAYVCLGLYSLTSVGGVAHYLFGSFAHFSWKMHTFIWAEELAGYSLIGFIAWSALLLKEWQHEKNLF